MNDFILETRRRKLIVVAVLILLGQLATTAVAREQARPIELIHPRDHHRHIEVSSPTSSNYKSFKAITTADKSSHHRSTNRAALHEQVEETHADADARPSIRGKVQRPRRLKSSSSKSSKSLKSSKSSSSKSGGKGKGKGKGKGDGFFGKGTINPPPIGKGAIPPIGKGKGAPIIPPVGKGKGTPGEPSKESSRAQSRPSLNGSDDRGRSPVNNENDGNKGVVNESGGAGPGISSAASCFVSSKLDFFQLPSRASREDTDPIFIDVSDPDPQIFGTEFLYNDVILRGSTMEELPDSYATGQCTRTQQRMELSNGDFVSGGGYCLFTYTIFDGVMSRTWNAAGEVFDAFGGTLAITGGTEDFLGMTGQIKLTPIMVDGSVNTGDVFTGPELYQAQAILIKNECLPTI